MKKILALSLAALLLVAALSGCSIIDSLTGKSGGKLSTAPGANDLHMVVTANDAASGYSGYETSARFYADYMNLVAASGGGIAEEIMELVNDQLTADAFILAMAEQYGITLTDEDKAGIEESKKNMIERLKADRGVSLNEYLLSIGVTESTLDYALTIEVITKKVWAELVSEDEIMAYFEENFVTVEHVLIKSTDDITDPALLAEIEDKKSTVLSRARAGDNFLDLVAEFGEDDGVKTEPFHYTFTKGVMVPEFEEMAFSMQVGEISAPVKTSYGYHIIKKIPMLPEYMEEIEMSTGSIVSIKEFIQDQLISETFDTLRAEWEDTVTIDFSAVTNLGTKLYEQDKTIIAAALEKFNSTINEQPSVG